MNRPALMGILNVTPDSFSGDGVMGGDAVRQAERLMLDGADILDIGAESTRPNAVPISAEVEWARLAPVLEGILARDWRQRLRLSLDTRHAQTAARALSLGVEIINDVSGLSDPEMLEILEEHQCDVVVMHSLSVPADPMLVLPEDTDVLGVILQWKEAITRKAENHNIARERLIYDPGLGFGKTAAQSLLLARSLSTLKKAGGRWLIGHSRKSFLSQLGEDRNALTLQLSHALAEQGADYLRVHDVAAHTAMFDQK